LAYQETFFQEGEKVETTAPFHKKGVVVWKKEARAVESTARKGRLWFPGGLRQRVGPHAPKEKRGLSQRGGRRKAGLDLPRMEEENNHPYQEPLPVLASKEGFRKAGSLFFEGKDETPKHPQKIRPLIRSRRKNLGKDGEKEGVCGLTWQNKIESQQKLLAGG